MQIQKETIARFKEDYENNLNDIDKYFAVRNQQLGWIDFMLTPTASILVETFTLSEAVDASREAKKKQEYKIKNNRDNILIGNQGGYMEANEDEIGDSWVGALGGRLVWFMLPGVVGVKDFLLQDWDTVGSILKDAVTLIGLKVGGIFGGGIGFGISWLITKILSLGKVPASYYFATILAEWTFAMIPLLAISTACLIAYISYLVSLCKYFYISPFVTAWAMATKRMDKIIDFLLAGIAIFLKPILIILFLYLALFLHSVIEEFFTFVSVEQFSSIKTSVWNFHTNFIVGAISGLLKIFGILATSYIAWKLIVTGPAWALGLVGLDGKQDDAIAQGIESNLARRAFVA